MASSSSTWAAPTSLAPPPTCCGSHPVTLRGYWAGSPQTMFYPRPRKSWGGRLQPLPPAAAQRLHPPPPVPTPLPLPLPVKRQRRPLATAPQKWLVKKLAKKLLQLLVEPAKVLFFVCFFFSPSIFELWGTFLPCARTEFMFLDGRPFRNLDSF